MDPVLAGLRQALAGSYTVEQELGRGGMAVVYRARDDRHRRYVAIKVMRDDVGQEHAADRFLREIETVAQLQHPHIVSLFDSGRVGGQPYFVMPFVDGESLRLRLERDGQLPLEDAIRIAVQVGDALAYAHEHGVVHRDIKPDNIMLSAGHALVADFGIARAVRASGLRLTDTGLAVGTPSYMSPEQATGGVGVDGRADQYALGCVLYEMLAGSPPFTGPTSQAILARQVADPVPPLSTLRSLPDGLEAALMRALAKAPADRFPDLRSMIAALEAAVRLPTVERPVPTVAERSTIAASRGRRLVGAVAALALLAASAVWGWQRSARPEQVSLAVLPMSFSGEAADLVLVYGLQEQLAQAVAAVPGLRTPGIARLAAYRDSQLDPVAVGKRLGVSAVMAGRIVVRGNQVRVFPELLDVASGDLIWTDEISGEFARGDTLTDWFLMQGQMARDVVVKLMPTLDPSSLGPEFERRGTESAEALRLYSAALGAGFGFDGLRQALVLLDSAVRIDSTYAAAWAALAVREGMHRQLDDSPADQAIRWRRAFTRALRHDPRNAEAYSERGYYSYAYEWNWEDGLADLRQAVRLKPSAPDPAINIALVFAFMSQMDSALFYAERAVAADPTSAMTWNILGKVRAFRRERAEAIKASERSLALDSTMWHTNYVLMNAYLDAGRVSDAEAAGQRMLRFGRGLDGAASMYALYRARRGDRETARRLLDSLPRLTPGERASLLLAAGEAEAALSALEEAVSAHQIEVHTEIALNFAGLRGNPRYDLLRQRVFGGREMLVGPYAVPAGVTVTTAARDGRPPAG